MSNKTEQEIYCELDDRIEAAITDGIRRGQREISYRRKQRRRGFTGVILTTVLLLTCMFTIKVSPVFAAMVKEIPGLNKFVDLINNTSDKGIKLALDNDFIQSIGVSDEHDGIKFTIQGIIADDSRMIVFYDIQLPDKNTSVQFEQESLSDGSGKDILTSGSFTSYSEEVRKGIRESGIQQGTIGFEIREGKSLPSEVQLEVMLKKSELLDSTSAPKEIVAGDGEGIVKKEDVRGTEFNVIIPIDLARFAGFQQEYSIGESIQIENQSITFAKAIVSPLRVSLYVDYYADNCKQIFGPNDIQLVDDEGAILKMISGSNGSSKDHPVYHFESPYFKFPKSLTIEGSWFRALDKNKMSIIVDIEKEELLQAPDDKLNLQGIKITDKYLKLDFTLTGLDSEDNMSYSLFEREFTDADGKIHQKGNREETTSTGYSGGSSTVEQHNWQYIENNSYKQPLTFKIFNYPAYIRKPYKIRIK